MLSCLHFNYVNICLLIVHTLHAGTFGKVYKGVYTKDKTRLEVAIKTLRGNEYGCYFSHNIDNNYNVCSR